jgi:RNA polymerase primary sigma factor
VEAFTPLIASVARIYARTPAVERTELKQEGIAGLLEALRRYDPELETPFWAYASWWVRQAMQRFVAETSRPVVLSDRAIRQLARIRDARRQLSGPGRQDPGVEALASATALPRERVDSLVATERRGRSLDEPLGGEEDGAATYRDLLADPSSDEPYERVFAAVEHDLLRELTQTLGARERLIVYSHFGFGRPTRTLREIAETLDLSAERVRQIEERALAKLRVGLEAALATSSPAA